MKKEKTQQRTFDEVILSGNRIHVYKDKLVIYNQKNIPIEKFKEMCDKLITYLIDESFIPKESIRIEIVSES